MGNSLWGEDFVVTAPPKQQKKIIDKVSKPKKVTVTTEKKIATTRSSNKVTTAERLEMIRSEVLRVLGVYEE